MTRTEPESFPPWRCVECGAPRSGPFCAACGNKALRPEDRAMGHLLREAMEAVSDIDGRLWRSLRLLVLRPGLLARDYIEGRRMRHLRPLTMFLLVNVLFFFSRPLSDLTLSLDEQMRYQPHSKWAAAMVEARIAERGIDAEAYASAYDAARFDIGKAIVFAHAPILALGLALMLIARRMYYAEHLVVATLLLAWILLLPVLLLPAFVALAQLLAWEGFRGDAPPALSAFLLSAIMLMTASTLQWAYRMGTMKALLLAVPAFLAFVFSHACYRLLHFLAVFALT